MRHVFAVQPGLSSAQWEVLLMPILAWKAAHHFVLTLEVRRQQEAHAEAGNIPRSGTTIA